jgi:signal peptidase II
LKRWVRIYWSLFVIGGAVVALDQWTKSLVRNNLKLTETWLPDWLNWLSPYARIVHWYNTGAAFGMFQDANKVFIVLAFIVAGLIIYYYPQVEADDWWLHTAMSLQWGGAVGNLVDRLLRDGKVTDFISVGTFPVFNVADSSITIGTIVLLLGVWLSERAAAKQAQAESETQDVPETGNAGGKE